MNVVNVGSREERVEQLNLDLETAVYELREGEKHGY